jgi:hypothetical protein
MIQGRVHRAPGRDCFAEEGETMSRCPGQDMRYWLPKDIFDVACPFCRQEIEFWKDEPTRVCPSCGKQVANRRIDLGCAKWCEFGPQCLAVQPGEPDQAPGATEGEEVREEQE